MRILVIAPHADDETLGMGGSIARFVKEGHEVSVALMTGYGLDGPHPLLPKEAFDRVRREFSHAMAVLGVQKTIIKDLPAVTMADAPIHTINTITKEVIEEANPECLYVPFAYDLHRDHRELFYSFSVHWRSYLPMGNAIREVYCYETPSETHLSAPYLEPAFVPNVYVDISGYLEDKLKAIAAYQSQKQKKPLPRSEQALRALAQLRGSQIGVDAAEAFVLVRKIQ